MRYLLLSLLFFASLCRADNFTPIPSKIVGPGGSQISVADGNATIQPSSGGAVNVVTGTVYVPTVLDFSTSVSPSVSGAGHSSLAFDGTNMKISVGGASYSTFGSAAWGGITGTLSSQSDLNTALGLKAPLISPSFTTPILGTPTSGTLTNCTGLPAAGVTGTAVTGATLSNATLPASFTTLAASGAVTVTSNTASSSQTTGALVVTGGIGAGGNIRGESIVAHALGQGTPSLVGSNGTGFGFNGGSGGMTLSTNIPIFSCNYDFTGPPSFLNGLKIQGGDVTAIDSNLICSAAGKGLQLKSGTGARAGNATLVGGTVTVANTTVTANTVVIPSRKTPGGTLGNSLSYSVSAGTSFTITSVDATGVLSALDTSVCSFLLIELN